MEGALYIYLLKIKYFLFVYLIENHQIEFNCQWIYMEKLIWLFECLVSLVLHSWPCIHIYLYYLFIWIIPKPNSYTLIYCVHRRLSNQFESIGRVHHNSKTDNVNRIIITWIMNKNWYISYRLQTNFKPTRKFCQISLKSISNVSLAFTWRPNRFGMQQVHFKVSLKQGHSCRFVCLTIHTRHNYNILGH